MTLGFQGDKTIPLESVSAVQLKPAGNFTNGYIRFNIFGGNTASQGLFNAVEDENSIVFTKKFNEDAASIMGYVEKSISRKRLPTTPSANISVADELHKLQSLVQDGVLSREEFDRQKRKLIA